MATYVEFYKMAFENRAGQPTGRDVMDFLKKIETLSRTDVKAIERKVLGERYRISSYYWPDVGERFVVIPIGKVKHGVPYVAAEDGRSLKELDRSVYDVNVLAYDTKHKVMVLTNHKSAPGYDEIEDYFNTFLDPEDPIHLRITPIEYRGGVDVIAHPDRVSSVVITLDLRAGFADMLRAHADEPSSMAHFFKAMAKNSRDEISGNQMKLEISLGRAKKRATLDKDAILDLIGELNIDSNAVKEIEVRYYGGGSERVDKTRLKESVMTLKHSFPLEGSQVGAEYLKNHLEAALYDKYGKYSDILDQYFQREVPGKEDNSYVFVEKWEEKGGRDR